MGELNAQLILVIAAVLGGIGTALSNTIQSWWNDKQLDMKINDAVRDSINAVEKESKTRPKLTGDEKYRKCCDFAVALLEYKGVTVKSVLLEVKIHSALAKIDQRNKEGV